MGKKAKKTKQNKGRTKENGKNNAPKKERKNGGKRKSKRINGSKKDEEEDISEEDFRFRQSVEEGGSRSIIEISADGNCLFRSISDQLYNDYGNMHDEVRNEVCDYIEANEEEFAVFLVLDETEEDEDAANFDEYCSGMREDGEWGGNVELVAAARLYRRNITVFSAVAAFTIEHGGESSGPDMLLSYHDNDHYNSVRDITRSQPSNSRRYRRGDSTVENDSMATDDSAGNDNQTSKSSSSADDSSSNNEIRNSRKKSKIRALKPNDPCSCSSGLRYKKCCLTAEKRREKLKKWKEKNGVEVEATKQQIDTAFEETGKLKVLSI